MGTTFDYAGHRVRTPRALWPLSRRWKISIGVLLSALVVSITLFNVHRYHVRAASLTSLGGNRVVERKNVPGGIALRFKPDRARRRPAARPPRRPGAGMLSVPPLRPPRRARRGAHLAQADRAKPAEGIVRDLFPAD